MKAVYAVQVVAQPLLGQVMVLVVKQDVSGPGTWRFPLTRHLWTSLGDGAGDHVARRYAEEHPAECHQLRLDSLAAAILSSLRSAEAAFRLPSSN